MNRMIPFHELSTSDLIIDAIYEGGRIGNTGDDPLSRLMYCGNQGGFRKVGSPSPKYVILYSSLADRNWPDNVDITTGVFTYYGDNKTPGHELHATPLSGNRLLRNVYQALHSTPPLRGTIPPFFVFTKLLTESHRSVQFRGLAVPGVKGVTSNDDLVAVWKSDRGQRFQNYRALFTLLDIPHITRAWLDDLYAGNPLSNTAPVAWRKWVLRNIYKPLTAQPTIVSRTIPEQLPQTELEKEILCCVFEYFRQNPSQFESCAAALGSLLDPNIIIDEITRPTVDGGRDAIGRYKVGPSSDPIFMDFALEAKCYNPGLRNDNLITVGVEETSRLISRLRHRQFGILVTTSAVSKQAYEELRQDQHPVILLCGRDIANLLISKGFNSRAVLHNWLSTEFPLD